MSGSRLKEYEALRGLSIVLLLTLHSEIYDPGVFGEALKDIGVYVASFLLGSFFFLAGYFTEVSLGKPNAGLLRFAWSKFIRIYPPYWAALALFITVLGYTLKRADFAAYLLNMQVIFSPVFVKPLLTLWYISMLVVFYVLFGLMLLSLRSSGQLAIGSTAVYILAFLVHTAWGFFDPRFFQYYFIFLAGVFFCRFEEVRERLFDLKTPVKLLLAVAGVALLQAALNSGSKVYGIYIPAVDFFTLSMILLSLTLFRTRMGDWRVWTWLSIASYFTYLVHRPLWRLLDNSLGLETGLTTVLIHLIPGSILALVLGYFLQRGYDRLLALLRLK